jgi:DNA-binding NarL/FixJ family response regulator
MPTVSCVVAAAQALNREALIALLRTRSRCRVVASADSLADATTSCQRFHPDLLILDHQLVAAEGAAWLGVTLGRAPSTRILVLVDDVGQRCTARPAGDPPGVPIDPSPCCDGPNCVGQLVAAGAYAVLPRSVDPSILFRAVEVVAARRAWFRSETMRRMAECLVHRRPAVDSVVLSQRERQVADLIGDGLCNKEISARLGIEVGTVKKHVGHILSKSQMRDRLQIGLHYARRPQSGDG